MGRVVVIGTGGTISMVQDPARGGAVPTLDGRSLVAELAKAELEFVEHCKLPSAQFTLDDIWSIRNRVRELVARSDVTGVVVSQGTDALEEVAYLLDITVEGEKPMVLTGAMRTASQVGWEGAANLMASIRVASDAQARGLGALVVLNDEVHAARYVTKTHTQSVDTFKSLGWGPLGRVDGDRVVIGQRVERDLIPCEALGGTVSLIKLVVGMDDGLLRYVVEAGASGVVLEVFGGGRVPPAWMDAIRQAISEGVAVVATSRCPAGRLYDSYGFEGAYRDLADAGVLFAGDLNGPKARIRLMAALDASYRLGVPLNSFFEQRNYRRKLVRVTPCRPRRSCRA